MQVRSNNSPSFTGLQIKSKDLKKFNNATLVELKKALPELKSMSKDIHLQIGVNADNADDIIVTARRGNLFQRMADKLKGRNNKLFAGRAAEDSSSKSILIAAKSAKASLLQKIEENNLVIAANQSRNQLIKDIKKF